MSLEIFWPKDGPKPPKEFAAFLQKMANRIVFGHYRYGAPDKRKKYLTRLTLELKAYKKTGNAEHLLNIANYALLEQIAPEHAKFHFNNEVDSVTRKKLEKDELSRAVQHRTKPAKKQAKKVCPGLSGGKHDKACGC